MMGAAGQPPAGIGQKLQSQSLRLFPTGRSV